MIERTVLNHGGLSAQELYDFLGKFTQKEREENQIFLRTAPENCDGMFGHRNLDSIDEATETTYGFFGESVSCIVLHTEHFATKEDSDNSNL